MGLSRCLAGTGAAEQGDVVVQVSADDEHLIATVPPEVNGWAEEEGMSLDEYVRRAVTQARAACRAQGRRQRREPTPA